ncbi:phage portal protein [Rhodococcus triatomae]|nr:bacteriophage protein [Rhodococcus triatomae BKS 15-14]
MALTPEQWLDRLTRRLDDERPRYALLRSFMTGNAPLPEGADGCREAYQKFQRKARTNFGELIVDAVADRMSISGFRVGGQTQDDDIARRIVRRNRLGSKSNDVHRDMLGLSAGYTMVQAGPKGAIVTHERPEQVITETDPLFPTVVRAGLKVYRDQVLGHDFAFLHLPGVVFRYSRPLFDERGDLVDMPSTQGGWTLVGEEPTMQSFVSIYPFENRDGLGEFETYTDVLNRINWDVLQRLVLTAMQAYRQRALKGEMATEDAEGNQIDYSSMFTPGAGALWQLPAGVELWESQTTDLTSILSATKEDIRELAAATRTPMSMLMPDSANQSAEGAASAREALVFKAQDRIARAGSVWDAVMGAALAIEQGLDQPVEDVETLWIPVERRTLQERADAASKAQDIPWRNRMTDIWGYSAEQVDAMEANRASDALNAAMFTQMPANSKAVADGDA